MNHHEIVKKLIGPIKPVGKSEIDSERFENLKATIELMSSLLFEIEYVAKSSESHESSVNKAGNYAKDFLLTLKSII